VGRASISKEKIMLARIGLILSAGVMAAAMAAPAQAREDCGFRWHLNDAGFCEPNAFNLGAKHDLNPLFAPAARRDVRVVVNEPTLVDPPTVTVIRPAPLREWNYDPGSMTVIGNQ
jgi:hypothetical protein